MESLSLILKELHAFLGNLIKKGIYINNVKIIVILNKNIHNAFMISKISFIRLYY